MRRKLINLGFVVAPLAILACFPQLPPDDGTVEDTALLDATICDPPCDVGEDPCRVSLCDGERGECVMTNAANGTACDDGLFCTIEDACVGGVCVGAPRPCDDGIACTQDTCDETQDSCRHDGSACPCGPAVTCDDGNPCNGVETCDESTWECLPGVPLADNLACDDGLVCTVDDRCVGGLCQGEPRDCDDGVACSLDRCEESLGGCVSDRTSCPCETNEDCANETLCDGVEVCGPDGTCVAGTAVVCEPGEDPCFEGRCVASTGACELVWVEGAPCSDADACTIDDRCVAGGCQGVAKLCDDDEPCTVDACDPDDGECTHVAAATGLTCPGGICVDGACSDELVVVLAGSFAMGCDAGPRCGPSSQPKHTVDVPWFLIDRWEVAAGAYRSCVDDGGCDPPGVGAGSTYDSELTSSHPINFVDFSSAAAYCAWAGKRLCTESEWEKAARGAGVGFVYPWGNSPDPDCDRAVLNNGVAGCGLGGPWAGGSKPAGESPFGAADMIGNVDEWVADCWAQDHANHPTDGSAFVAGSCSNRVTRGGSFGTETSLASGYRRTSAAPYLKAASVGFRCCRDL